MLNRMLLWLAAAGLLVAAGTALAGNTPTFVKKDTWVETFLASREAVRAQETEAERAALAARDADPALKTFEPVDLKLLGADEPRAVKVRVTGMKKVYVGADGPRAIFLADLRFVDASGNATSPNLDKAKTNSTGSSGGGLWHDRQADWKPVKWGDRAFEKGCRIERNEMELDLGGNIECVEFTAGVTDKGEKRPSRVWVNWRSTAKLDRQRGQTLETTWRLVQEAFPDQLTVRERRLEEAAGIWREDAKAGDWPALAEHYARAAGKASAKAQELAKGAKSLADVMAVRDLFYIQHAEARLALAEKTLAYVEKTGARPEMGMQLKALQARLPEAEAGKVRGETLYAEACALRRSIILSHPLLDFPKLLVNKRSGNLPEHMCDQFLGRHSQVAPGLVLLENWKDAPKETVLLEGKLPRGGLIHPDLSYDGKRVLFAFADATVKDGNQRGYYIYEYTLETGHVRQVTGTDRDPMEGRNGRQTVFIEDMDACYLPDGGIAFMSTRSQQYGRCHGGRYVPSYTMYRAELDGSQVRPLSFNESNEWAPSVLEDGTIVYCRWDYVNRHDTVFQSLWTIHPDGTQTAHYYGNNSRSPCMISEPQPIPGTHKTISTAAAHHGQTLGTLIVVDPLKGQEDGGPLTWVTPELVFPESGVPSGITRAAAPLPEDAAAPNGRAATPWPLSEDLFLCTYQHGAQFGVYLVDTLGGRELIAWDPKTSVFDPIPVRPRAMPPALPSALAGHEAEKTGVFVVENVYDSTEKIPPGTIKSIRINQIISQPTSSVPPRSAAENEVVKRILGTVPVNADGSVAFEAPADTPVQLQLLDADGMAVMTMRSLVYVQRGERAACAGCHEPRLNTPPVLAARQPDIRKITPPVSPQGEQGLSFMRSVQPVLDRYCIGCHGLDKTEKDVDLTGSFMPRLDKDGKPIKRDRPTFSVAYESLLRNGMVKVAPRNGETTYSKPNDYFAHAGKLAKLLLDGHPDKDGKKRVELDRTGLQRIADWLDLNAQFYGDYSFNRIENQPPLAEGEKALRAAIEKRFGTDLAKQPYAALVNVANPAESRILMGPLPASAGGWGQITTAAYRGADDPAFDEMRGLVAESITPLKGHDIAGTCGRTSGCSCGNCWVRKVVEARKQRLAGTSEAAPVASR